MVDLINYYKEHATARIEVTKIQPKVMLEKVEDVSTHTLEPANTSPMDITTTTSSEDNKSDLPKFNEAKKNPPPALET